MKRSPRAALMRSWRRLLFVVRRASFYRELNEELENHRQLKEEDLRRRTSSAQAAAETSRREMGNLTFHKEESKNVWSFMSLERIFQDLRYAARVFQRTPIFTAVAVSSLALGIGGNAAMFSLVNALLVRPLPYFSPDRLMRVTGVYPRAAVPFFQQRSRTIDIAAVSSGSEMNLAGQGTAIRVFTSSASCNFLHVLGASVAQGRGFRSGEDVPGRDGV
ncbi:MAG: ABC transporter permease, partial [Acidobacteriaceae bacterium]|nr:ABC transporter permease [Acidobacteriaceae bacterium]